MAYPRRHSTIRIWWDSTLQGYCITSPYAAPFVDAIKSLIPSSDRIFFQDQRMWCFSEKYLAAIISLCEAIWGKGSVVTITKAQSRQTTSSAPMAKASLAEVATDFLRVLPYEAAQKAYRHAAMMLHPDRGGDMTRMTQLNTTWERIRKEIYNE